MPEKKHGRSWLENLNHQDVQNQVRMGVEDLYLTPQLLYVADGDNGTMLSSSEEIVRFLHARMTGRPEQEQSPDEPGYERRSRVETWTTRGAHATQP